MRVLRVERAEGKEMIVTEDSQYMQTQLNNDIDTT